MKIQENESFGIVTACHKGDYHFVKATLASIKHFCPNVPICVIVDGDLDVSEIVDIYHPYILRVNEIDDSQMKNLCSGRSKLAAMWCGPFERYIYLDSDAIIWGDVVSALNWQDDEDFIVFWPVPQEAAHKSWLTHYYFDIELLQLYDPQFQWEWNPYFCSGAFASRRGAIPFDEWLKCESWRLKYPHLFSWTNDQGILNYLVFSLSQQGKLKLGQQDLQWIPEHRGVKQTVTKFNPQGWSLPTQVESPYILHFCGKKPYIHDPRSYSKPFSLARLQHYQYSMPGKMFSQIKNIAQEEINIVLSKIKRKFRTQTKLNIVRNYVHRIKQAKNWRSKNSYLKYYLDSTIFAFRELLAFRQFKIQDGAGNKYLTPVNNFTSFATYINGSRDEHILRFLLRHLKKGDVVIDVGANIGTYTIPLSHLVGDGGLVISYEPDPEMLYCLNCNVLNSKENNVIVRGSAVGCFEQFMRVDVNVNNRGQSIVKKTNQLFGNYVNCVLLDKEVEKLAINKPIRLIKIDVEGFECNVIHGAYNIISENENLIIIMEHLPSMADRSEPDKCPISVLKSFGFQSYSVSEDGILISTDSPFGDNVVWTRSIIS